MTNQPSWKCLGHHGDVNGPMYGGALLMVDERGIYDPEIEVYVPCYEEHYRDEDTNKIKRDADGDPEFCVYIYRFEIPRFVIRDGLLVDESEPGYAEKVPGRGIHQEWWVDKLDEICRSANVAKEDAIAELCSEDPLERSAIFYYDICGYYGYDEFDSYPLILPISEADARWDNKKGENNDE